MTRDHARDLRKNATDVERKLWRHLRQRQLAGLRFRRQVPIGPFIADFVCHEAHLIVELDGGQHAAQAIYDSQRSAWLNSAGYRVLRFCNIDILENLEGALEAIASAAGYAAPPP